MAYGTSIIDVLISMYICNVLHFCRIIHDRGVIKLHDKPTDSDRDSRLVFKKILA